MRPVPRAVYALREEDYRYGLGPIVVKVTKVLDESVFDNEPWWNVECYAKHPAAEGPGQPRTMYIRAASLRTTSRPPSPEPER